MSDYKCYACGKELTKETKCSRSGQVWCAKHYQQLVKHGRILDTNPRTQKDGNEIIIYPYENCAYVTLYDKEENPFAFAKIDIEDIPRVRGVKWRLWEGRAYTGNFHPVQMAYFVMGMTPQKGLVIDHKNSDPLDNRKENLRVTTQSKNLINRSIQETRNTTGFIGVWYKKSSNRWVAEIRKDGIKCYLGGFRERHNAVYARYYAEKVLFGKYRTETRDDIVADEIKKCTDPKGIENLVMKRLSVKFSINMK